MIEPRQAANDMNENALFTIGHSNRTLDEFIELLRSSGVSAIADVRSQPYSRHMPHFNRDPLSDSLRQHGIAYVFVGEELGARRSEECCYIDGQAKYELIEATQSFQAGLDRIRNGTKTHCIALMCAEKDPITCHRTILIAKALRSEFTIRHIISADRTETQGETDQRLLRNWRMDGRDLFQDDSELLEQAYEKQATEIAYVNKELVKSDHVGDSDD